MDGDDSVIDADRVAVELWLVGRKLSISNTVPLVFS